MSRVVKVAAIQMVSTPVVAENLAAASALVEQAAVAGARLVALPEYFCILGRKETDKVEAREVFGAGGLIQDWLAATARRHGVWIVGGTMPIDCGSDARILNTCLVVDDQGRVAARYDKIHLFGFRHEHPDGRVEQFDEARSIRHGDNPPVAVDTPAGRAGLSVCYDLRFPELYRTFGAVDLILVPSAFTATTGQAHWETLLRARAIENLAYVLAPAQGGLHPNGRRTHGHSMFIDPWGRILAERAEGPGVVMGEVDPDRIAQCRASLPALSHRTLP